MNNSQLNRRDYRNIIKYNKKLDLSLSENQTLTKFQNLFKNPSAKARDI